LLENYFLVNRLTSHSLIKDKLISLIKSSPGEFRKNETEQISRTDFHLKKESNTLYSDFFAEQIKSTMDFIQAKLSGNGWQINHLWYQIYEYEDFHDWHTHWGCSFSNVYYLSLSPGCPKTQFYDTLQKRLIEIEIKEGDLVSFPSFLLHRSPPNLSKESKIIISFNSNFPTYDVKI